MISVRQVSKTFRTLGGETIVALATTNLDIATGAFVSLIGPSGCGKSTLLRIIAGLEEPTTGSVIYNDGMSARERRIGFVFQEPVLLPWLTALENIRFPLDMAGVARKGAQARADELLELVGLAGFGNSLPKELSGGMRQRAAIARALSYDPAVLLMDEPFGALDLLTRDRLNDELLAIWKATGKTIVFVTHSVEEAAFLSDEVVVMTARPGTIRKLCPVDLPRPRDETTKLDPRFHHLMAEFRRELR